MLGFPADNFIWVVLFSMCETEMVCCCLKVPNSFLLIEEKPLLRSLILVLLNMARIRQLIGVREIDLQWEQ